MKKSFLITISGIFLSLFLTPFLLGRNTFKLASASSSNSYINARTVVDGGYLKDDDGNIIYEPNSKEAFLNTTDKDFYGVKCDIYWTKDKEFIAYRDDVIDYGGSFIKINQLSLSEILSTDSSVCTFKEIVDIFKNSSKHLVFNISDSTATNTIDLLVYLTSEGYSQNSTIISTDFSIFSNLESTSYSGIKFQYLASDIRYNNDYESIEIYNENGWLDASNVIEKNISVNLNYECFLDSSKSEYVTLLKNITREYGLDLTAHTLNDYNESLNIINQGIDFIITDELLTTKPFLTNYTPYVINEDKSTRWVDLSEGGNVDIYNDGTNSQLIKGLVGVDEKVRLGNLVLLDGLSFTMKIDDFKNVDDNSYSNVGFYFSASSNIYLNPNLAAFSFLNSKYNSNQKDIFGVYDSYSFNDIDNNPKNHTVCYSDDKLTNKGFSSTDGTLVLKHRPVTGLHFSFDKVSNAIYKVTVNELYENTMLDKENGTTNYQDGTTYAYINASKFGLDANGRCYLYLYGIGYDNYIDFDKHIENIIQNDKCIKFVSNFDYGLANQYVRDGTKLDNLPSIDRTGYTFLGWYITSDFTQEFNQNNVISEDMILYAKWAINVYSVKFIVDEDEVFLEENINYFSQATKPANPTKKGYVFVGWYKDNDFEKEFSFTTRIKKDTNLYAKFEEIDNYYTPIVLAVSLSIAAFVLIGGLTALYIYRSKNIVRTKVAISEARRAFKDKNKEQE